MSTAAARRTFVRRLLSVPALVVLLTAGLLTDVALAAPPTITSFSPQSGPVGTSVTIKGTNFNSATEVKFKNTVATFTVDSNTRIKATVPSGTTTGPISVTTPDGTATSSSDFVVTATAAPSINSFSPTFGPVGTVVTINGTNFTGATDVKFKNKSTTTFTVNSDTKITA
ncbi:MAG: IPT/TIG domain-containing protein, partial [Actinomycetota bacterium]